MTSVEPPLAAGDAGEWVLRLQTRLQALGMLDGPLDGAFGEATKAAVTKLQEDNDVAVSGDVGHETWLALSDAEKSAGLHDPFAHPAAGSGAAGADHSATPVGTLSEDEQWRWDGDGWQPNENRLAHADPQRHEDSSGHLSADGQWRWDGDQWQAVT
jgi:peptidoglycan hydrolase-like protein with peptidoglycan-binding domain